MPAVFSTALGGGTKVEEADGKVHVGPESVGHRLTSEGLIFGGNVLTTTGKYHAMATHQELISVKMWLLQVERLKSATFLE